MLGNLALTLFFVLLNAFFVAAEFALVKVRGSQVDIRLKEGDVLAKIARHILDHLDAYLSACQLGITLASLALGWIGEPVVAAMVGQVAGWTGVALHADTLHTISIILAFTLITVLHIVIGELAPKTFAIRRPEAVTFGIALPLHAFYLLFQPFIRALNWMSVSLLKLLGMDPAPEHEVHTSDELRYIIAQSSKQGTLEVSEQELIENVFDFTETTAGQVMVPRSKISAFNITSRIDLVLERVMEEGYSRLPVYKDTINDIVGIIYVKDLITLMHHKDLILIEDILHPVYFVQEDVMLKRLLRDMQVRRTHMAIVLDEFGGTAGLVTMEDIIEELVGNIQDEYDDEAPLIDEPLKDTWVVDASIHIDEANELLPKPLPKEEDYETVGGLINYVAGRIPATGDGVLLDAYAVTIVSATPRRVERVQFTLRKPLNTMDESPSHTT
ncbi:MAG: HlyC/CorC family transporter [Bradyrhizobiaceae bacterium]|nr:HlyC/CorC family transporter [Bradyrhizobiaceae bacterium]